MRTRPQTPAGRLGSGISAAIGFTTALAFGPSVACAGDRVRSGEPIPGEATSVVVLPARAAPTAPTGGAPTALALGVADVGVFSDLDPRVELGLSADLEAAALELVIAPDHGVVVLYADRFPVKVYPTGGPSVLAIAGVRLALRSADRTELAPHAARARVRTLAAGEVPAGGDRDGDGIPDPLDVLVGAIKNLLNAAPYRGGYRALAYPGGDLPRDEGVCTDVVVRALRNAGLDLQRELRGDVERAPRAYPMVRRPDPNIDHRRVKTALPYFLRHLERHGVALDDARDPLRPGDVVFLDTFPSRPGPDHIGVLSARRGPSGALLVINAWTDGFVVAEMDLLPSIPLTHRFRVAPRHPPTDAHAPTSPALPAPPRSP